MMSILETLKSGRATAKEIITGEVIMVDPEAKAINCKNPIHQSPPDLHGKRHQMKVLIVFNHQSEIVCEGCGTIYRKIRIS